MGFRTVIPANPLRLASPAVVAPPPPVRTHEATDPRPSLLQRAEDGFAHYLTSRLPSTPLSIRTATRGGSTPDLPLLLLTASQQRFHPELPPESGTYLLTLSARLEWPAPEAHERPPEFDALLDQLYCHFLDLPAAQAHLLPGSETSPVANFYLHHLAAASSQLDTESAHWAETLEIDLTVTDGNL